MAAELAWKQAANPVYVPPDPPPFVVLMAEADDAFAKLAKELAANGYVQNFGDEFLKLLIRFHAESHFLGQQEWGRALQVLADAEANRVVRLGRVIQNPRTLERLYVPPEADYVAGFMRQLIAKDPRYVDGEAYDPEKVLTRLRMYEGKVRGTQGAGVLDGGPVNQLWKWVLGAVEDHCADCPYLAGLEPVTRDEWFTTPGSGDTPCLWNCQCTLVAVGTSVSTADPILRLAA